MLLHVIFQASKYTFEMHPVKSRGMESGNEAAVMESRNEAVVLS